MVEPNRIKNKGYKRQWGVIVVCSGEDEQRRVFERLAKRHGPKRVKVVVT